MPDEPDPDDGEVDRGFFARLEVSQVLSEYVVPVLFLAVDPQADSSNWRHWLINWRKGGPLSARGAVPPELAGTESWIAVQLSERRRLQIVEEHISLRESILLSEKNLYILEGPDPLQPTSVERIRPFEIPPAFLPTAEVSVFGNAIPFPAELKGDGTIQVLVHIVPGGESPVHPTWAISAPIQECISRYVSRAARGILDPSTSGGPGSDRIIPAADWAGMSLVHASQGTLVLVGQSSEVESGQLHSIETALNRLKSIAEGGLDQSSAVALQAEIGREGLASLFALTDLLHQLDVSVSLRWRSGAAESFAMIGDAIAKRTYDRLNDHLAAQAILLAAQAAVIVVRLTGADADLLRRPVDPQAGGHQALIAALQGQLDQENVLRIRPDQIEKVVRYVQDYGQGGFQDRLRPVYLAIYELGLSFVGLR
jgi:hypothetical protein